MSRQLGLCIPLAYLIIRLMQPGDWRLKSAMALGPLIFCATSLILFNGWLRETGKLPAVYYLQAEEMLIALKLPIKQMISRIAWNLIATLLYLGLFSLPILLLTRRPKFVAEVHPWLRRVPLAAASGTAVLAVIGMLTKHRIMPVGDNILIPQGIGPLALRDTNILGLPNVPSLPTGFWIVVTLLSVWGLFELTARGVTYAANTALTGRLRRFEPSEAGILFAVTVILAYYAPLMLAGWFDRYHLPVLPITMFFLVSVSTNDSIERYRVFVASVLSLLIVIFAVLAVHDYLSWNRARWTAITDLQIAGIATPANLDGGFEYNGLFSYDPSYRKSDDKSWWWVHKGDYLIAFGPIGGMKVVNSYAYKTLLLPAKRAILVLSADPDPRRIR
jgi:hypothetical protein